MLTEKRISLWSGPRNVSTAFMYSFAQRPDTRVVDEPLYGHYLRESGAQHPGRDEVLSHMELDGQLVVTDLCNKDYGKKILFIKNMAHHLVNLDLSFLDNLQNLLLIRDPKEMIPSMIKQVPHPTLRDTGLKRQWELYMYLKDRESTPIVIDSKHLLLNPSEILTKVCQQMNLPYLAEMTQWSPGPLVEDGIWAKHWYHSVHKSSGFQPYTPKKDPVPNYLRNLWKECDYYYQKLLRCALKAT